jgi:hypothetical protein
MTTTPEGRLDPPAQKINDPSAVAALLRRLHFYAAQAVRPDLTVTAVRPAAASGDTTWVLFDDPTLGESERRAAFVDPVTAQPLGGLAVYGSSGALPLRTWIGQTAPQPASRRTRAGVQRTGRLLAVGDHAGRRVSPGRQGPAGSRLCTVDPTARGRTLRARIPDVVAPATHPRRQTGRKPTQTWCAAGRSALAATALVAVAVGWFVPLFGLSPLGFAAVDAAIGLTRRRNAVGGSR